MRGRHARPGARALGAGLLLAAASVLGAALLLAAAGPVAGRASAAEPTAGASPSVAEPAAPGGASAAEPGAAVFVDAVVGEVEGGVVTASDVALARALGLFELPAAGAGGAVEPAHVERLIAVRLGLAEARALGMEASAEEMAAAWRDVAARAGGPEALAAWLATRGIDEAWARQAAQDAATWRRFVDERFRAFAFVSPDELAAALGPGAHSAGAEEAARERLREAETARALATWLAERRQGARLRVVLEPGRRMPLPFE